jgi:hypothetical protein
VATRLMALVVAVCGIVGAARGGGEPSVLNVPALDGSAPVGDAAVPARLRLAAGRLVAEFVDGKHVDYDGLRDSEAFGEYFALAASLDGFDLDALDTQNARLAFWINLYNALVLHSVLESGVEESVREQDGFFDRYAYVVGGLTFTPNDIEHGVLRGVKFDDDDARAGHVAPRLDPRLHFALNCASAGCPPIGSYSAAGIDEELDLAARSFVNSRSEVRLDPDAGTVTLSPIFDWYAGDFGFADTAVHRFLLDHLNPGEDRDYLATHMQSIQTEYTDYDWSLNH